MSALREALRRKYRTPADALRAIGLPTSLLGDTARDVAFDDVELAEGRGVTYAYDNGIAAVSTATLGEGKVARPMRARRYGRDEELDREELRELIDDVDSDFGDLLAAVISQAPDDRQEEVHEALRELGEDRRGPRNWARDRLERRRLGRDARRYRRRYGRDTETDYAETGRDPDRDRTGEDRRRYAHDMAIDSDPRAAAHREFNAWFPNASKIERS